MHGITNKLEKLNKVVKQYKPVWDKSGKTFEYVVQERLRNKMGSSYSRGLTIRSLSELASEALPPEMLPSEKLETNRSMPPQEIAVRRSRKLAAAASKELDGLRSWVSEHENGDGEANRLMKKALDCKKLLTTYDSI